MAKQKYYVVWVGHNPGIYFSWPDCQKEIKNYPDARYKSFKTMEEAEAAFAGTAKDAYKSGAKKGADMELVKNLKGVHWVSVSVDAACSGNPGVMEYQGVDTKTGNVIFRQGPFPLGTNNVGEFLALVHALALLQKQNKPNLPIYTDSRTATAWVRNKKVKTNLVRNDKSEALWQMVDRAVAWLKSNSYQNPILKWETKQWGEIPADFGRK